jgi:IS605 OrfB family transposase
MERTEVLGNKEANFKDSYNKKTAHRIVEFAIKNNCGIIQMEDLTGYDTDEKFLKNWTYYDLQEKIKNKASEYGIETKKVIPNYTSLRCSRCEFIDKENRDCKKDQAKFECIKCNYGKINDKGKGMINADINAAKNISLPNIESIILQQLESQSKINDTYLKMYKSYKKALSDRDKREKENKNKVA